jgi:2-oxoglutarate ferredoxin oxidoreductase subunit gamma
MHEEIIIAGFGGQGIMLAGKLLAQTAMKAGKEVTYMPSYGAEVRGGTANCMVVVADEQIASPLVDKPDCAIVMNKASMLKFSPKVKAKGLLIYNSSLIEDLPTAGPEVNVIAIPADEIAVELGSAKISNMVVLGAYLGRTELFTHEQAADALSGILAKRYHNTLPMNAEALRRGAEFAKATIEK